MYKPFVLGVEVEVEFKHPRDPAGPSEAWVTHADGSLRHYGVEFVLEKPLSLKEACKEVSSLCAFIDEFEHYPDSPRTSVHVHVNVVHLNRVEVLRIALAYWLLEPALNLYCGPSRQNNHFCMSASSATGVVQSILRSSRNFGHPRVHPDTHKYSGLNFAPLASQGSIEFRSMRGVYDPAVLTPWLRTIDQICRLGAGTPVNVLLNLCWEDPRGLVDLLVPDGAVKDFILAIPDLESLLTSNTSMFVPFSKEVSVYEAGN